MKDKIQVIQKDREAYIKHYTSLISGRTLTGRVDKGRGKLTKRFKED